MTIVFKKETNTESKLFIVCKVEFNLFIVCMLIKLAKQYFFLKIILHKEVVKTRSLISKSI